MKSADFDYHLPPELIAQTPAAQRDQARLLVVHRATRTLEHRRFFELPEFVRPADVLFRNVARVRPARLRARRPGGGAVECLLLRPAADAPAAESGGERWWCLLRPGRKLPPGTTFAREDAFTAEVVAKTPSAEYLVAFHPAPAHGSVAALAEACGAVPLPPYIQRKEADSGAGPDRAALDRERYQTVFADQAQTVAVAAPTAGLHFTPELLARLAAGGVNFADVVLHVGLGTFRPLETDDVAAHPIHREIIEVPPATRALLAGASPGGGRRIAVGTTTVRTLETYLRDAAPATRTPSAAPYRTEADLFIHPPFTFRSVDVLVTNFHLPRSTLLCLVAAFLTPGTEDGVRWLHEIYAEAIRERYRFLSYGDAMLIL